MVLILKGIKIKIFLTYVKKKKINTKLSNIFDDESSVDNTCNCMFEQWITKYNSLKYLFTNDEVGKYFKIISLFYNFPFI